MIGIVGGMALAPLLGEKPLVRAGASLAGRQVLQASVVILGLQLSVGQVAAAGARSLPVMLGTLAIALVAAFWFGRLLRVTGNLRILIGVGTGICGASAIASATAVLDAGEDDVVYAISTIFFFNVVAVLLYPALGHFMHLSQQGFGLWAGTAINDTSSVVAASSAYGVHAAVEAVVVKLARTLMIVPIVLALQFWVSRSRRMPTGLAISGWRLVPWFIPLFVLAAVANSLGLVPSGSASVLGPAALFLITVALTGVGLSARFDAMRRTGLRPLLMGASLWAVVGLSSLSLQTLTGTR